MASRIDTVTARDKLKAQSEPYWQKIAAGTHIGFRKLTAASTGSWYVRTTNSEGKYERRSLGELEELAPSLRYDAAVKEATKKAEHLERGGSNTAITIGEACTRCVQWYRDASRDAAANDAESRFKRWVHSDKRFADLLITKATPGHFQDWRNRLTKAPLIEQDRDKERKRKRSPSTINRDMAALKVALNLALEDGYATSDFAWASKLKPAKNATARREVYLDITQRRALISAAQADLALLLRGMSALPMRPGAIAALVVGNFDKRLGTLKVGKDKTGKDRTIPLPLATAELFAEQCKDKLPTAPIFARADGSAWNKDAWKYPFKDAAKAAGLPPNAVAYVLRHSTITDLIAVHGLDTLTVSQLAGTSLTMIEKHYGHLQNAKAAEALAKLAI